MSGGSFDYLYLKDAQQICAAKEDLREMADTLRGFGANKAWRDTVRVLTLVESLEQAMDDRPLMDVWHAIEWWKSADWAMVDAAVVAGAYPRKRESWHAEQEGVIP